MSVSKLSKSEGVWVCEGSSDGKVVYPDWVPAAYLEPLWLAPATLNPELE